jgi:exopolysaccharide biosynthesis polyprenyl glycosylphosphotransferase
MSAVGQPSLEPRLQSASIREALPPAAPSPAGIHAHDFKTALERLALTQRAPQVMRRHLARTSLGVSATIAGDTLALLLLRFLLSGVRDMGWFGATASAAVNRIVPEGALPLVQLLPAVLLGLTVLGTYGTNERHSDAGRLVAGATLGLSLPFWGHLWAHYSPWLLPGFFILAGMIGMTLIIERHFIDYAVRKLWPLGPGAARALLIGQPRYTRRAFDHPALSDRRMFSFGGFLDPDHFTPESGDGCFGRLCQTVKQHRADTLVLCGPIEDQTLAMVIDAAGATGCQLFAVPRSWALAGVEGQTIWRRGASLVAFNRPGLRAGQLLLKRVLDVVGSIAGILILAPLMAVIALAVRLDSRGPVVFSQRRIGLRGNPFRCYKFRSMKLDAEELLRSDELLYDQYRRNHFKLPDQSDPRLTRVGRFLRKTSLDELPQLWNVLFGEMSLVGPRPVVPDELDHYGDGVFLFLSLKPGMTGAWAVQGRSQIGYPDRVDIELTYVREWSIWKDLGLLLKTVPAVVSMRGAS